MDVNLVRQGSKYHIRYSDRNLISGPFSKLVLNTSLMVFLGRNEVRNPVKDSKVQNIDSLWNFIIFPYFATCPFPQKTAKNHDKKNQGPYLALNQKSNLYKLKAIVVGTICMRWIFDLGQKKVPEFFLSGFFWRLQPPEALYEEFHISNKTVVMWLLHLKIMLFQQIFIHIS